MICLRNCRRPGIGKIAGTSNIWRGTEFKINNIMSNSSVFLFPLIFLFLCLFCFHLFLPSFCFPSFLLFLNFWIFLITFYIVCFSPFCCWLFQFLRDALFLIFFHFFQFKTILFTLLYNHFFCIALRKFRIFGELRTFFLYFGIFFPFIGFFFILLRGF